MLQHVLDNNTLSYVIGLLQADAHHAGYSRNRGKVTLEIRASDRQILEFLQEIFPVYSSIRERTRDTNFKQGAKSVIWTVCDLDVRSSLLALGLPTGDKSETITPPTFDYSAPDYFRGLFDGDGSLGYTKKGFPFLSFITKSALMAKEYEKFLHGVTGKLKRTNPNTRDQVYNICVWKEDAQAVASYFYTTSNISLGRKYQSYLEVMKWVRPLTMRKVENRRMWVPHEDEYVLSHDLKSSSVFLGRTLASIRLRRWRLLAKNKLKGRS
jgi:LAGLIDADG-like domain